MRDPVQSVCVFCGSSSGARPDYERAAVDLGRTIAQRGLTLVYGGSKVGLMGAVADAALAAGGRVHGVIPQALVDKELAHAGLTQLDIVASMHERKARMADLAGGFVALPGGAGTLEEIFEVWTWAQLGFHAKPVGFLNAAQYYDRLEGFLDHTVEEGFIRAGLRDMLIFDTEPDRLLDRFANYVAPVQPKWIHRGET
jgi:uncharacterized protein (TIGR00730 family)